MKNGNRLQQQYGAPSEGLAQSFELQNFDLVNSERVQHKLEPLKYSNSISDTARKHSEDMAEHNYFDHNNLSGDTHLIVWKPMDMILMQQVKT